jgi:hypothetical protein
MLRQDPARPSGSADRADAVGADGGPVQGDLRVGLGSAPGRAPGQDTRHHGRGTLDRGQCLP